ncbi:hypothetical protein [Urbifossiella limnaea]|uniref:Glycosyltransferase RgtA/B/C/D-like domain-containing protein n=1 Tax=Urbifossiella limnaea TaxID=2528023 RepID=A0A517XYA5_9BACT|nr:hypothetical protein [Urbifossiella limnaea]QDU22471.1 hypothetical protein ETAA1_44510 [Urbifossiella limnaea]
MTRRVGPGAVAFVALFVLLLAAGRSSFFRDPGTFWHVTTGDRILADGFLRADPYTFTFGGTWWVPYQWLGEVAMALAHRCGGFDLLLVGACAMLAGTFAVLYARLHGTGLNPAAAGVVLLIGLAAAASHFHVRPHLATIAGMTGTMLLLVAVDGGRAPVRRLLWLVPAFVLWTNVHGGVLAGMGTVGLTVAGWLTLAVIGRGPLRSRRDAVLACAAAAGCVLSALVNPYGLDLLKTWHVIMGEPALKAIVQEHSALDPAAPYAWPVFALAAVYLAVLAGVHRGELRVSWFLPAVWFVLTLDRVRHAPLFAVAGLVVVAAAWPHTRWAAWLAEHRPDVYRPRDGGTGFWRNVWLPAVLVIAVALVPIRWARLDPAHWPVELLPELREFEPRSPADPHRIFNGYIDGGFVIYHAPGYKVFVDDRCEVFGGDWLLAFVRADSEGTADAMAGWEERYGRFDFALVRAGTGFEAYVRTAPGWELVKRTDVASFYRRR